MKLIILVCFATLFSNIASAKNIEVSYKDLSYSIKQDSKKIVYQNKNQKKEYLIKKCNKAQFDIFWSLYRVNKKDLSSLVKFQKKDSLILKENKKSSKINPYSKAGTFLRRMPAQIQAFDVHERTKCSK